MSNYAKHLTDKKDIHVNLKEEKKSLYAIDKK